ncbi:MAG: hypothetical protein D6726_07580 [Nitrospirae bacterium]|nr:MAG: hypothetical protein D6726_07580 [Nitrospirota bacterium]
MRRGSTRVQIWINIISLILIFIYGTLLAERHFITRDMTEAGIYSLSDATVKLLKGLNDRLTIKVLFSEKIPYPYNTTTRYVMDMLNDYRRLSGGKIVIDVVDPGKKEEFEREAGLYGIPPVQVNAIENDQIQIKKVYMGLAFVHADKIETLPVVSEVKSLEYEVSSTIKSLITEKKKTIGFLTGHGEKPLQRVREFLSKQYEIKTVNTTENTEIKDVDLLVVAGPTKELKEDELFGIDQFLLKGGKALFLLDPVVANLQYGFGRENKTGVEELLSTYGVKIARSLVYDLSAGMVNVSQRRGGFIFTTLTPYPFFPKIIDFNRESIITKDIETMTLGFSSPIETEDNGSIEVTPLIKTSEKSGVMTPPFYVSVERKFRRDEFDTPHQVLGVIVSGKLKSRFPEKEDAIKEGQTRFVLVSDSEFVSDEFIGAPGNAQFLLNAIDWLSEDDSLISIRSKDIESRPIKELEPSVQRLVRYLAVGIPPMASILLGLFLWFYRKGRRVSL